jgi:hypothetical protein
VVAGLTTQAQEPRMDVHENARTTQHSRMLIVRRLAGGWSAGAVALAQGSPQRPCAGGATGMLPRARLG